MLSFCNSSNENMSFKYVDDRCSALKSLNFCFTKSKRESALLDCFFSSLCSALSSLYALRSTDRMGTLFLDRMVAAILESSMRACSQAWSGLGPSTGFRPVQTSTGLRSLGSQMQPMSRHHPTNMVPESFTCLPSFFFPFTFGVLHNSFSFPSGLVQPLVSRL